MKRIIKPETPPTFISYAATGGYEEKSGPLGDKFDFCDVSDRFGKSTWETSEGEMGRCALNLALSKIKLSHCALDLVVAGDLQNQCVASSVGLSSFGAPYVGIYGACSTCTEGLALLTSLLSNIKDGTGACVTTSHNSAAERQFRTPVEYGAQRTPSSQWTATASGAFILSSNNSLIDSSPFNKVIIADFLIGKMQDGATRDASNMGAAMAFAAADSIITYFEESPIPVSEFDYIVTGDLGKVGSDILREILSNKLPAAQRRHVDCGLLLYDLHRKDVHSGASGCGTSASVLACHFLPMLEKGDISNILFLSTGALMSQSSVLQGNNIIGIAPAVRLCNKEDI